MARVHRIVCLLACLPAGAHAQAAGRIEGTALLSQRLTQSRARIRVYDEPGTPPPKPDTTSPLANVVIYLETTPALAAGSPPRTAAALHQSGERFVPHVLPVTAGTTVEFPNDDPIFHNVFSLAGAGFDLGRYPQGQSRSRTFTSPGVVPVFCHIHSDMSAYIVVVGHAFFAVPDAQGKFTISGIPPGDYRLVAWHERIKPMVTPVRVTAGRATTVSLRIPIPDTPANP